MHQFLQQKHKSISTTLSSINNGTVFFIYIFCCILIYYNFSLVIFTFGLEKYHLIINSGINDKQIPQAHIIKFNLKSCQIATKVNTAQMLKCFLAEPPF